MCPEKEMRKGDATREAVREEISSALVPRGMSVDQMMGRPEIKSILANSKNPGDARSKVAAFLSKRGLSRRGGSATSRGGKAAPAKQQKK
ncbi:MAG: hypothetical protein ABH842_04640 [Candidatus Micrarchaeota archaeon]